MPRTKRALARPHIYVIAAEADILSELALSANSVTPLVVELLLDELGRATPFSAESIPPDVVTMRSRVEYLDESNGRREAIELVFPGEADSDAGRISILTPIGAALIGMRVGKAIEWPDLAGRKRILRILSVSQPPASATRPSR